ncbi:MAG: hypothetical protein WD572_10885 [Gammaproteobacteria bacterium]
MDKIKAYMEKIDALSIRERGMILLAVLAVIIFLWDSLLMAPIDVQQRSINSQLEVKRAQNSAVSIQIQQKIAEQSADPNKENREKLVELRAQLAALASEVQDTATDMIEPAKMPDVLRTVINQISNLTLTELSGLGVSPLITAADAGGTDSDSTDADTAATPQPLPETGSELATAFKHGMQIQVRGNYLTMLEYLRRLEAEEWHFLWDSFELQVGEYPDADSTLTIYTLSLTRDWIRA